MTKTLEERIERAINQISSAEMGRVGESDEGFFVFKEDGKTKHFDILLCKKELCDIIEELHEQNQDLLAKNIKDAKEHHQDFNAVSEENQALQKKLDEALGRVEIAKEALNEGSMLRYKRKVSGGYDWQETFDDVENILEKALAKLNEVENENH